MTRAEGSRSSDFAPTIVSDVVPAAANTSGPTVSRPPVDIIAQTPHLSDETSQLLRYRLRAAVLVVAAALLYAFVRSMLVGVTSLLFLRLGVLLVFVAAAVLLSSRLSLKLKQLRVVEVVVFLGVGVQVTLTTFDQMTEFTAQADAAGVASVYLFSHFAWSMIILIYGIFMPNTWKRAALVLVPAACAPYVVTMVIGWQNPEVARLLAENDYGMPVPMAPLAAAAAIYASHIVHSVRRAAFKARRFGQYQLRERLGQGGMGEVYLAEHLLLKRPCAIKLIRAEQVGDPQALIRFEREVKATARLTHWNTIEIYDYGQTADGVFYYVMELLHGLNLGEIIERDGPLPPERAVHLLRQTCCALREAHASGLVHRDIKPANIFAAQIGGVYDVAKLLDFGLVRESNLQEGPELTGFTSIVGTVYYMPPEQAMASHYATQTADIYSLGAVAYQLVTGEPPFERETPLEILMAHSRDPVVPPSKLNSAVPDDLERVILRCLEKKADDRFASAEEMEHALAACAAADRWTQHQAAAWWDKFAPGTAAAE